MICENNKRISADVKNFIKNVSKLNEESITDYLVWKWRELDRKFNYIKTLEIFTHEDESKRTGADLEMELWLVGKRSYIPLVFQAKKFIEPYDSYLRKLNYPEGTQRQLNTLLNYAKTGKKPFPFYLFYSLSDSETKVRCSLRHTLDDVSVFMVDAHTIKDFANKPAKTALSRNEILAEGNPFHCLFCCPLNLRTYLRHYFKVRFHSDNIISPDNPLPEYVSLLLNNRIVEMSKEEVIGIINRNKLQQIRIVGVFDLRESEEEIRFNFNGELSDS